MPGTTSRKTHPKLTPAKRRELAELAKRIDRDEKAGIIAWARSGKTRDVLRRNVIAALKAARREKGLSLNDVDEASGIGKSNLSRLENDRHANPTLDTLLRYAEAVGVDLHVAIVEK